MRRRTVKSGLKLITGSIVSVILATFFHDQIATLLFLSPGGESQLIYLGLFWGGIIGFCGILVSVIGFLRTQTAGPKESLRPSLVALLIVVIIYFVLLYASFRSPEQPQLRPGETITI